MPLRRTKRSDSRQRLRWKDGSHLAVENTHANESRCNEMVLEANHRIEPLVIAPLLFQRSHEHEVSTRDRPARAGADARIEEFAANGELRLALRPYGRYFRLRSGSKSGIGVERCPGDPPPSPQRGVTAIHDFGNSFGLAQTPGQRAANRKKFPPAEHPVVRTHPVTGRKCIYVNGIFTSHVVGLEPDESDALLRELFRQAHVPEFQCRFHWGADSVAFWDNRSTQHYASSDYWPQRRVMERLSIIGDRPF